MSNRLIVSLLLCALNSCILMPPGAPHGHSAVTIGAVPDPAVKLGISCLPHHKNYVVFGTAPTDSVYVRSRKLGKDRHCKPSAAHGDGRKIYTLSMGDMRYHRRLMEDTITIKLVRNGNPDELYKFLVVAK